MNNRGKCKICGVEYVYYNPTDEEVPEERNQKDLCIKHYLELKHD